jgi:hypothetical protein
VLGLAPALIVALPPGDVEVEWMKPDRTGLGHTALAS